MRRVAQTANLNRCALCNEPPAGLTTGPSEQTRVPSTAPRRWEDTRLKLLSEVAYHTRVSPRTFMKKFAPHLHPIRPLNGHRGRCKLLFDRHELDQLLDRMTGTDATSSSSPEDLTFLQSQMEKRLS